MAALRTSWDPPYRSHHQRLGQPRQAPWDLPGERRSRGVRTYDQPQPPHLRGMHSRLERPKQPTYRQTPQYTGMGRYELLIDLLDTATSRLESRCEEIDRRVKNLQTSKAAYGRQPYADFDSRVPRRRLACWDPPFQTSNHRVRETRAPPLPEPPLYRQSPYTDLDSSYEQPRQYTSSTCRHPPYSSDVPPQNPHAEYHQWRHEYKPSRSIPPPQPPSHRRSAAPLPAAAAPPPPRQSDRPPQQSSPASSFELPLYASPGAYRPLQPLPVTAPLLAANPPPQAVVPSSLKKEEEDLLDDVPSPPAMFSMSCNSNISGKKESLLEDGVARERKTIKDETPTATMKKTNLLKGDENGLMDEVVNCLHEVSYPSVMVCALTCAGGSDITREVAGREKNVVWNESIVKVRWKENAKGPKGLVVGKGGAVSDIFKMITLIPLCAFDPGICVSFSKRNCGFLATQLAEMDLRDENEKLHIDNVFWNAMNMLSDEGRSSIVRYAFDPGGDVSPKLLLSTLVVGSWFPP